MGKTLKITAWTLGVILALLVALVIIAPLVIDPNDYRDEISTAVERQTGRELTIEGELGLSVFPWLGLELGAVQLGNAEGFGPEPFARIEEADVRVKLLPLLRQSVEMDTVVLYGLRLNLARRADGTTNWADLAAGKPAEPAAEAEAADGRAAAALALGGLRVRDARVVWDDRMAGQRYVVENLSLTSGAIQPPEPFPLELAFDFQSAAPEATGRFEVSGEVTADPEAKQYRLDDLAASVQAEGPALPGGAAEAELAAAALVADLAAQTARLDGLRLSAAGVTVNGRAAARDLQTTPQVSGHLESEVFSPRKVMAELGLEPPEMKDPEALGRARLSLDYQASPAAAELKGLKVELDETTLTGTAAVREFAKPLLRFELKADRLNADRYLPPKQEGTPATPAQAAAAGAGQLPLEPLRTLDVQGSLVMEALQVLNLKFQQLRAEVDGRDGRFRVHPLTVNLYDGGYNGDMRFDVRGERPKFDVNERLEGVQVGPLLADLLGKAHVTGTAFVDADLQGTGIEPEVVRKTLSGTAAFEFKNGAVQGINIAQMLRKAQAALGGGSAPEEGPQKTDFTELTGSVRIDQGVVRNDDLSAKSPLLRVDGAGQANLVKETVDYRVKTAVVGSLEGQGGKEMQELKGLTVPIRITGTFSQPKYDVELDEVLKAKAEQAVEEKKEELKEEAKRKLEDKLKGETQDKGEDAIKDKLKGLFR